MAEYAIIGFGCAGYYGAKTIRENDPNGKITVFSEHSYSPYNPMLTTYYVANKIPFEGMFPFGDMYKIKEELNLNVISGKKVAKVDTENKTVVISGSGNVALYALEKALKRRNFPNFSFSEDVIFSKSSILSTIICSTKR